MPTKMNSSQANNLVTIRDLSFSYGERQILSGINLDVPRGIALGIVGPNGGGKTTLLKIMMGLLKGYTGRVEIHCQVDDDPAARHHYCIGYVPQKSVINTTFPATVRDAVEMGLYGFARFWGASRKEKEYIDWLLNETGVWEIRNKSISEISGGQLQRALIARALVAKPSLITLDEPLTGVDESGVLQFIELIMGLKRSLNLTVVMVTHDFHSLSLFADRVACLNGTIHSHDNPEQMSLEKIRGIYSCGFEAYQKIRLGAKDPGGAE